MSIAWATVVIVVLLLPGFAFFWGLYSPNQVTREVSPASPLAQLAGVVIISFLFHACAYFVINTRLCLGTGSGALAGLPGLALPCAPSREGLPIGMQLVGRYGSDDTLLDLGAA